jgi:hypothetical protein
MNLAKQDVPVFLRQFSRTKIQSATQQDWSKLAHLLGYLYGTVECIIVLQHIDPGLKVYTAIILCFPVPFVHQSQNW